MLEVVLECTTYGGDPRTHPLPLSLSHPRTQWRHPMATPYHHLFISIVLLVTGGVGFLAVGETLPRPKGVSL